MCRYLYKDLHQFLLAGIKFYKFNQYKYIFEILVQK